MRRLAVASILALLLVMAACGSSAPQSGADNAPPAPAGAATTRTPAGVAGIPADSRRETGPPVELPEAAVAAPIEPDRPQCPITPRQTEGPFYFDIGMVRRDIIDGRPGTPLLVNLRLVEAGSCEPIGGATVDIWHTDAAGHYSGYPGQGDDRADTSGETFLRGRQITDANGLVEFETIYPGWYPGRTVHIHFKAFGDRWSLASQLYFPDEVSDAVFAREPYAARGSQDTPNPDDSILARDLQDHALMGQVTESGSGYAVSLTVGISR